MIFIPSLHPAFLLRSAEGDKSESRFEHTVVGDFARAKSLIWRRPEWDESQIKKSSIYPSVQDVIDFCRRALGHLLTVDIESTGPHPYDCTLICIGLGFGPRNREETICIPILKQGGHKYWTQPEEYIVLEWLRFLLADERTPKNFQNGAFDTIVLWRHDLPVFNWREDTLLAHYIADGEMPHGLDFLASIYEEITYYKGDIKGDTHFIDLDDTLFRTYNLRDILVTHRIQAKLLARVEELQLVKLYRDTIEQAKIMAQATVRGMYLDKYRRDSTDACKHELDKKKRCKFCGELNPKRELPVGLGPREEIYKAEALQMLRSLAGDPEFNPASPPQLKKLFFDRLKFPVVSRTAKGNPAIDKNSMILFALHADTAERRAVLEYLIKWRQADKLLNTYIYGLPIGSDDRLHVIWKVFGTVSGRYASSPNAQNLNYVIKRLFCAPEGYTLVGIDLSQAELRAMGYIANDPMLIDFYKHNCNVHTITATTTFMVRNPGVDTNEATEEYLTKYFRDMLKMEYTSLPTAKESQWKEIRKLAKNLRFGWQYKGAPETLYNVLHSKRDPDTNEQMFPDLERETVEAACAALKQMHPRIVHWWSDIVNSVMRKGYYKDPLSGRIRWFRAGFKENEIVNTPIQGLVASHMIKIIDINNRLNRETPSAGIISQVHDAITLEVEETEAKHAAQIMVDELSKSFELPNYPEAYLPPDEPSFGKYYNEV